MYTEHRELRRMLACWGKLGDANESGSYHPLLCHMLDVASVAREMWRSTLSPRLRRETTVALGFLEDQDAAGVWCAFLAGLHDLGKASPTFQLQVERVREPVKNRLRSVGLRVDTYHSISRTPHGAITAATLPNILTEAFGLNQSVANRFGVVVGGHHGSFPTSRDTLDVTSIARGTGGWDALRCDLVEQLADVLGVPRNRGPDDCCNAVAMVLAGITSVADWIGSNTDFFPYIHPTDLAIYNQHAETQAQKGLDKLGWRLQPRRHGSRVFTDLFPKLTPNDLQIAVESLAPQLLEPGLVIIEAPMGEGKTEAAMYLADHWAESTGQQGCYFALPTQATSNQMFGRVRDFLESRYEGDQVQLQLLHGHAALSSEFQLLRRNNDRMFTPVYGGVEDDAGDPAVVAAEWFTYRKRGLLAPFGVGTVDQVLLAALQTRHVFVRLFGLAHKTVIVDEVHAYDTYMTTLLERLLEWLAALGSSVVLLSATLPRGRRQQLLDAYSRGLGTGPQEVESWGEYPRVSWVSPTTRPSSRPVQCSPAGEKTISLEWTDGFLPAESEGRFGLGELLKEALAQGGCAAVICNTVRRAQEVYLALKHYFPETSDDGRPELDLLHSQYLFEDREERERRSLVRFGKPEGLVSGEDGEELRVRRPERAVLVATQVIEQSLDIDFDLMVTDMAPADLLLQRAGRLHRHGRPRRPSGLGKPRLLVCRPTIDGDVPRFDSGTAAVYDPHVLLRSWLALNGRTTIKVPDDVEPIIEQVYDDQLAPEQLTDHVRQEWMETRKNRAAATQEERDEARTRWIKSPEYSGQLWRLTANGLEEDAPEFHLAHQALTRLAPPSISVVFLFGTSDHAYLDHLHEEPVNLRSVVSMGLVKRLLRRSARISDRRVVFDLIRQSPPTSWQKTPLLKNHRLILLNDSDCFDIGKYQITLDAETGVMIARLS